MSDNTPTERFETPPAARAAGVEGKSRRLLYILIGVGAALLIAIVILLIALLTRTSGDEGSTGAKPSPSVSASESASPTPSVTPSVTPSEVPTPSATPTEDAPPPPPPPTGPVKNYSVDKTKVNCNGKTTAPMHFSWDATGVNLWFGVGTDNAKNAPYDNYPLTYELDFDYQCGQAGNQQKYTITVEQANGDLLSKTIVVKE
jgi:hypothetical protein